MSREEEIKRKLLPVNTTYLTHFPSSHSPLSHPPQLTGSPSTLNSHPPSQSSLPTPHTLTTSQTTSPSLNTHQSHTSDPTWNINNDDIIDSLSEMEEDDEFLIPVERVLHSGAPESRGGEERITPANSEVIEILSSPSSEVSHNSPSLQPFPASSSHGPMSHSASGSSDFIEINSSQATRENQTSKPTPSKPTLFHPPFASTTPSQAPHSSSLGKPSQGAMPDNAAEFQGPYTHTQEMMKIFTQVCETHTDTLTPTHSDTHIHSPPGVWNAEISTETA